MKKINYLIIGHGFGLEKKKEEKGEKRRIIVVLGFPFYGLKLIIVGWKKGKRRRGEKRTHQTKQHPCDYSSLHSLLPVGCITCFPSRLIFSFFYNITPILFTYFQFSHKIYLAHIIIFYFIQIN